MDAVDTKQPGISKVPSAQINPQPTKSLHNIRTADNNKTLECFPSRMDDSKEKINIHNKIEACEKNNQDSLYSYMYAASHYIPKLALHRSLGAKARIFLFKGHTEDYPRALRQVAIFLIEKINAHVKTQDPGSQRFDTIEEFDIAAVIFFLIENKGLAIFEDKSKNRQEFNKNAEDFINKLVAKTITPPAKIVVPQMGVKAVKSDDEYVYNALEISAIKMEKHYKQHMKSEINKWNVVIDQINKIDILGPKAQVNSDDNEDTDLLHTKQKLRNNGSDPKPNQNQKENNEYQNEIKEAKQLLKEIQKIDQNIKITRHNIFATVFFLAGLRLYFQDSRFNRNNDLYILSFLTKLASQTAFEPYNKKQLDKATGIYPKKTPNVFQSNRLIELRKYAVDVLYPLYKKDEFEKWTESLKRPFLTWQTKVREDATVEDTLSTSPVNLAGALRDFRDSIYVSGSVEKDTKADLEIVKETVIKNYEKAQLLDKKEKIKDLIKSGTEKKAAKKMVDGWDPHLKKDLELLKRTLFLTNNFEETFEAFFILRSQLNFWGPILTINKEGQGVYTQEFLICFHKSNFKIENYNADGSESNPPSIPATPPIDIINLKGTRKAQDHYSRSKIDRENREKPRQRNIVSITKRRQFQEQINIILGDFFPANPYIKGVASLILKNLKKMPAIFHLVENYAGVTSFEENWFREFYSNISNKDCLIQCFKKIEELILSDKNQWKTSQKTYKNLKKAMEDKLIEEKAKDDKIKFLLIHAYGAAAFLESPEGAGYKKLGFRVITDEYQKAYKLKYGRELKIWRADSREIFNDTQGGFMTRSKEDIFQLMVFGPEGSNLKDKTIPIVKDYVCTTTDKKHAESFAGDDGYLYKIDPTGLVCLVMEEVCEDDEKLKAIFNDTGIVKKQKDQEHEVLVLMGIPYNDSHFIECYHQGKKVDLDFTGVKS